MTTTNDITGNPIISRVNTKTYEENWERIFGKKNQSSILEESQEEDNSRKHFLKNDTLETIDYLESECDRLYDEISSNKEELTRLYNLADKNGWE